MLVGDEKRLVGAQGSREDGPDEAGIVAHGDAHGPGQVESASAPTTKASSHDAQSVSGATPLSRTSRAAWSARRASSSSEVGARGS